MRNSTPYRVSNRSSGFTLVELLVGIVLSLFVVGVTLMYMVSSAASFKAQSAESFIQENARFALDILSQEFRLSGLNPLNEYETELDVIYTGDVCGANESGVAANAKGSALCTRDGANDANQNNSDRVAIDYAVTNPTTTCGGVDITASMISASDDQLGLASVFWTADLDNPKDGVRSLYCQTFTTEGGSPSALNAPIALIDGIERMQVQYGVDENSDGAIDAYKSYTELIKSSPLNPSETTTKVRSIRYALLVGPGLYEGKDANTEKAETRKYSLLDAPDVVFSADDRLNRQIFSTTTLIPNSL